MMFLLGKTVDFNCFMLAKTPLRHAISFKKIHREHSFLLNGFLYNIIMLLLGRIKRAPKSWKTSSHDLKQYHADNADNTSDKIKLWTPLFADKSDKKQSDKYHRLDKGVICKAYRDYRIFKQHTNRIRYSCKNDFYSAASVFLHYITFISPPKDTIFTVFCTIFFGVKFTAFPLRIFWTKPTIYFII